jgi:hypothetical protein
MSSIVNFIPEATTAINTHKREGVASLAATAKTFGSICRTAFLVFRSQRTTRRPHFEIFVP